MSEWMKVSEAADYMGVTNCAIYLILKKGRFPNAKMPDSNKSGWRIPKDDVIAYMDNKYSRDYMYNHGEGKISVNQAAKLLDMPAQIVYYFVRKGYIKYTRDEWHYLIDKESVEEFKKKRME